MEAWNSEAVVRHIGHSQLRARLGVTSAILREIFRGYLSSMRRLDDRVLRMIDVELGMAYESQRAAAWMFGEDHVGCGIMGIRSGGGGIAPSFQQPQFISRLLSLCGSPPSLGGKSNQRHASKCCENQRGCQS